MTDSTAGRQQADMNRGPGRAAATCSVLLNVRVTMLTPWCVRQEGQAAAVRVRYRQPHSVINVVHVRTEYHSARVTRRMSARTRQRLNVAANVQRGTAVACAEEYELINEVYTADTTR
jgi:hypothetical protein